MKRFVSVSLVLLSMVLACTLIAATDTGSAIDATTARGLAIAQYNLLFRDKYYLDPADQTYHQFPQLSEREFHKAEMKDGCWQLECDPSLGVQVHAKVSADGKWVQLTRVDFVREQEE